MTLTFSAELHSWLPPSCTHLEVAPPWACPCCKPDSGHRLYCHVHTPGKTLQLQKRVSISQGAQAACGPRFGHIPNHWPASLAHLQLLPQSPTMQQAQPPSQASSAVWAPVSIPHSHRRALRARPPSLTVGLDPEPVFCHWPAPLSSSVASPSHLCPCTFLLQFPITSFLPFMCPWKRPCSHRRACKQPYVGPNPALYCLRPTPLGSPTASLSNWVPVFPESDFQHWYLLPCAHSENQKNNWYCMVNIQASISASICLGPDPYLLTWDPTTASVFATVTDSMQAPAVAPIIKHGAPQLPALEALATGPEVTAEELCYCLSLWEHFAVLAKDHTATDGVEHSGINQQVSMLPGPGVKNIIYIQCPTSTRHTVKHVPIYTWRFLLPKVTS